jgi:hypothetical protein
MGALSDRVAVWLHAFVAVTESVTVPDEPAVNTTLSPVPDVVIVPPVMLQVCVIPEVVGTDALFPLELPQTEVGAVIVGAVNAGEIAMVLELDAMPSQRSSVAVTVRITLPDAPAVNVIDSPVAADVIVPPEMPHVWVMFERAGTDA